MSKQEHKRRSSRRTGGKEHEIVLICNPQAGGRWRELAKILDSKEARHVRRIVTDSIDDIGPALSSLGRSAQLVCIYGGDGTIQRLLDRMLLARRRVLPPQIAFIGGGTMNVTASWCGNTASPGQNFRKIVRAYRNGELLLKEVPLLRVSHGDEAHLGFTFGCGIPVRILDAFERGSKRRVTALTAALGAVAAAWTGLPTSYRPLIEELPAEVVVDGEALPGRQFSMIFCNVTGRINPGVEPFVRRRRRDTFYYGAYAVGGREVSLMLPLLIRGVRPIDPKSLLKPVSAWRQAWLSLRSEGKLPVDPRYTNDLAQSVEVRSPEGLYTVDGELFDSGAEPVQVTLGPVLRLAVSSTVGLRPGMRLAAEVTQGAATVV